VSDPAASTGSQPELGTRMSAYTQARSGSGGSLSASGQPEDWAAVLDSFETDLRNAEWLLSHGVGDSDLINAGWTPPEGLGPLPAEYCEWVRSLLDRQATMYTRLVSATSRSRQRGTYVNTPTGPSHDRQSQFIDARA
jgi:hypothetical protein